MNGASVPENLKPLAAFKDAAAWQGFAQDALRASVPATEDYDVTRIVQGGPAPPWHARELRSGAECPTRCQKLAGKSISHGQLRCYYAPL